MGTFEKCCESSQKTERVPGRLSQKWEFSTDFFNDIFNMGDKWKAPL